jgi:hypothetical protein
MPALVAVLDLQVSPIKHVMPFGVLKLVFSLWHLLATLLFRGIVNPTRVTNKCFRGMWQLSVSRPLGYRSSSELCFIGQLFLGRVMPRPHA